jgi:hypothetical protein
MNQQEAREILAAADVIYSVDKVQEAVVRVAEEIRAVLAERNPLVLCVMTGGVIFAGQLLPRLEFPLDFDYLHVTRYGHDTQGPPSSPTSRTARTSRCRPTSSRCRCRTATSSASAWTSRAPGATCPPSTP